MALTQYRLGRQDAPADFFLATTSGSGQPRSNYVVSLAESMAALSEAGMSADYYLHAFDCHVDDARNTVVRMFLESDAPILMFIDDDVGWRAKDLIRVIRADGDIVGGAYPIKSDVEEYPIKTLPGPLQARPDGLLEVAGLPTGFMAIKRHVLEALVKKKKWTAFRPRTMTTSDTLQHVIFERTLKDGHRWSGDYDFCNQARQLGFKSFVDPEIAFSHEGPKQWRGHFGRWLRQRMEVVEPDLVAAYERLASGDLSSGGDVFFDIFNAHNNPYAACPSMLAVLHSLVSKLSDSHVLETGSGLSTIVMGIAAQTTGVTIHALEHDPIYFRETARMLQRLRLKGVRLYYAPLKLQADGSWWYDISELPDEDYSIAICDGPPRRYGLLRQGLHDNLGPRISNAVWIVDDVDDTITRGALNERAATAGREVEVISDVYAHRQFAVVARPAEEAASSAA